VQNELKSFKETFENINKLFNMNEVTTFCLAFRSPTLSPDFQLCDIQTLRS